MSDTDYRAASNELLEALSKVQDWDGTRVGDAMDAVESALLAAPEARPPVASTPQTLRPVDRYTLGDAIRVAWLKHGNDSWCSIADEVIAALAAPEAAGVAERKLQGWDVKRIADRLEQLADYVTQGPEVVRRNFHMSVPVREYEDADVVMATAARLLRDAHPAPVPATQGCPNCGSHRLEWVSVALPKENGLGVVQQASVFALGCQECSETVQIMDGDAVAALMNTGNIGPHPAPVPVGERSPGVGDCDAYDCCWWWAESIKAWDLRSRGRQMVGDTHWLPHWALPLPGDQ